MKYNSNEVFLNSANYGNKRRNLMRNKILYYEVYLPLHTYQVYRKDDPLNKILSPHSILFSNHANSSLVQTVCHNLNTVVTVSDLSTYDLKSCSGCKSPISATMHRRHSLLHAVKKSTREVKALVRERVLPWYKGEEWEMGKTDTYYCVHT